MRSKKMTEKREETVVDLLLRQHEQIRRLFSRVAEGAGKAREEAFEELRYLLVVHETAEEEIVHPFARRAIGSGARLTESRLEEAKETLQELDRIGTDSVEF